MAKEKSGGFFCSECGYESVKWLGFCPVCKSANTFVEAPSAGKRKEGHASRVPSFSKPVTLDEVEAAETSRISVGIAELDRVLGGGIVPGSLILLGGDPGIGKSTLLMMVCDRLARAGQAALYVSGEESLSQLKMRAQRMHTTSPGMRFLSETHLENILDMAEKEKPAILVVDSIQTLYSDEGTSAPGSVTQVREATYALMRLAKENSICVVLIGHVTKEGVVAGPRMLEHMVDTVLYFEGDRSSAYRMIRSVKNRFGATNELGVFEMEESGLKEVPNPSQYLLEGRPLATSGSAVTCLMEGSRPMLLEIQALVCKTSFGNPRRTAAGLDYNRVNLLMAVLEKRAGISLSDCDAYVNVAGGMRVNDPSMDLAVVAALYSSAVNAPLDDQTIHLGEVGLSGEVRSVSGSSARIEEAARLGFTRCVLAEGSAKKLKAPAGMKLVGIRHIQSLKSELIRPEQ